LTIDVTGFTQYATNTAPIYTGGDGEGLGSIMGYQIASDGTITASLSSGSSRVLGSLALATFMNEDGLQRIGSTLYTATDAAGDPTISAGDTDGFGAIKNEQLERSNVDIAGQFSELIIVQRAYQANSQIISVSNDLLRNTLALIR
jgi:flagellar hook protein FlgE